MKRMTEEYGRTVEEAIRKGLETLKVSRDDVKIVVIDEPSKGMLGMLSSKMAKVRLTIEKKVDNEQLERTVVKAKEILENIFKIANEESTFVVENSDGKVLVKINSGDSSHLIGYKGKTIEAIQSTINSILQREEEDYAKVFVEVNDYKNKKEERLKELARRMAKNAVKFGRDVRLEPMSAYERMIIHTELANRTDVTTESYGEEPRRRVVIKKVRR